MDKIRSERDKYVEEVNALRIANRINGETADTIIKQRTTELQEQALRIQAQELGLVKTQADIAAVNAGVQKLVAEVKKIYADNEREWSKLDQNEQRIKLEGAMQKILKTQTEFNTSTPQQVRQWTDLAMSILTLGFGAQGGAAGGQPAGFKLK